MYNESYVTILVFEKYSIKLNLKLIVKQKMHDDFVATKKKHEYKIKYIPHCVLGRQNHINKY